MSDRVFSLFAYHHADDGDRDERRERIPEWRVPQAVAWALARGFDAIHVDVAEGEPSSSRLVTHHVCSDAWCPGGCD